MLLFVLSSSFVFFLA